MDAVILARIQFAGTILFHFIFAPLTIGLAWLIVWLMARYWKRGDEESRTLARFWINLFAISFAVGVATGFSMEFQFGTNWSKYSRYVGDIFGAPLAIEVVFTFFLESIVIAILLFGWDRISRSAHLLAAVLVAIGSTMSAFWILVANSWMQTPAGYMLHNGRAEMTNFLAVVFNHSTIPRVLHTVDGALVTGAFFMLGVSAWFLRKGRQVESFRITFIVALFVAFLASVGQLGTGHLSAWMVTRTQPEKLAAFEGLFTTQAYAPLTLFGVPDVVHRTMRYAIRIPSGLSLLAYFRPDAVIKGLDRFDRRNWPPIAMTFYPFHLMFWLGMLFIGFPLLGLVLWWFKKLYHNQAFLTAAWLLTPLPFLANELGWLTAEMGRQPWIVYNVLLTRDAVSVSVPAIHVLLTTILFGLIYTILFIFWAVFFRKEVNRRWEETAKEPVVDTPR